MTLLPMGLAVYVFIHILFGDNYWIPITILILGLPAGVCVEGLAKKSQKKQGNTTWLLWELLYWIALLPLLLSSLLLVGFCCWGLFTFITLGQFL